MFIVSAEPNKHILNILYSLNGKEYSNSFEFKDNDLSFYNNLKDYGFRKTLKVEPCKSGVSFRIKERIFVLYGNEHLDLLSQLEDNINEMLYPLYEEDEVIMDICSSVNWKKNIFKLKTGEVYQLKLVRLEEEEKE